jgi:hypothetical protein
MYAKGSKLRYTYFGARYGACPDEGRNSELSLWLSVDPLADKYPSMSPYMYTAGNPVMLVDPDGMSSAKPDYYEHTDDEGNKSVIYRDGHAASVDLNGEKYTNIGSTYSKDNGDGSSTHYVQNTAVAVSSSENSFGEVMQKGKQFRNAMHIASQYDRKTVQEVFDKTVATGTNNMSNDALALMGSVVVGVLGGEYLLAEGILSTEFWAGKALISAGTQAIMNNGNVDMADVVISTVTTPGAGALLGGLVDVRFSGIQVTGYNKPLSQTVTDIGTGALGGKLGAKGYNSTKSFLEKGFQRGVMNATMNVPTSVLGVSLNKAIKNP